MNTFCLIPEKVNDFKKALKERDIKIVDLINMSSEARTKLLEKYAGENAKDVNLLFERKLVLKNKVLGIKNWASKIGEIGRYDPNKKAELTQKLKEYQERQQERIFNPKEDEAFLNDLADTKLGTHITKEEAKNVFDLTSKFSELKESFDGEKWTNQKNADLYGATQVALEHYIEELKTGKQNLLHDIKVKGSEFKTSDNKIRTTGKFLLQAARKIADISVSAVASFDNSLFGRQAIMTILTGHPLIWGRNFGKSFADIVRTLGGQKTTDALKAKIYSDPFYINGEYKKAGIIDMIEEQFPTSLPERIPLLGRGFKASEAAFKNGSLRIRTELYKLLREIKVKREIELTDREIKGMGRIVNSIVARGTLGRAGDHPVTRLLMWAPKMLKADLDILTAHSFEDIPKSDRKTAVGNLLKIVTATAIIESIALANNQKVEFDPRSSKFLQVDEKYGFLRGIPQIITLMARMVTGQYKTATGEIKEYSSDFGQKSRLGALGDFLRGKAPPATGGLYDVLSGKDYQGNPPTFTSILLQRGVPISIQNLIKLSKDPSIDNAFGVIGDFFGLNTNINPQPNIKSKVIPEGEKVSNQDLIEYVQIYANAIGSDPETAFNRIFTGQKIRKVTNGTVIVERMSLSDSQEVKKKANANNPQMKLDHTVPLELGGGNDTDNLKLVSTSTWSSYTKVENVLGKALKKEKISKNEAQNLIKEFKSINNGTERKKFGDEILKKYR